MEGFEIINTYSEYISAKLAQQQLEAEGIISFLKDEHTVTMNWMYGNALGGIKLFVHESQLLKAQEILKIDAFIDEEISEKDEIPPLNFEEELAFDAENKLCPRCNSKNTMSKNIDKKSAIWSILILGFPLKFKATDYHCFHCNHDFTIKL